MVTNRQSLVLYTVNSGFETVLCNCGYCATKLKAGHPLYIYGMCGRHSLGIGTSIGPYACGEPVIAFSSRGVCGSIGGDSGGVGAFGGCKWGSGLLKSRLCFLTS